MPVYNGEIYLREAIDSILKQSYKHFEFLIVNDGSTDGTEQIITSYTDKRIVYIKNENNLGVIESLNKGIFHAKGNYIARMDADDIAGPHRLLEQVNVFKKYPKVIVAGTDYYILNKSSLSHIRNYGDSDYSKTMLLFAPCFCHPTVMIRNMFRETGLSYEKSYVHAEDYKLWTVLSFHGQFYNINKPLLKYRSHGSQISVGYRNTQLTISERIRKEYLTDLGFKFSESQFEVHNYIGNNDFIRSYTILMQIESWLSELVRQNIERQIIPAASFNAAIHKFWIDSCGNTNLGWYALHSYFRSGLSGLCAVSVADKIKLPVKCIVRKFRD